MAQPAKPIKTRDVNTIIIHCAETPNGSSHTVDDINKWHGEPSHNFRRGEYFRRKFNLHLKHIGYHLVIYSSGVVATGRHFDEIGAHAYRYNRHSIGICMIGTDKFTLAQWESLKSTVTSIQNSLEASWDKVLVIGHNRVHETKTCPNFSVGDWIRGSKEPLAGHVLEVDNAE